MTDAVKELRPRYINYGLRESYRRFHKYIKDAETQNSSAIVSSLSELLMWIDILDEWYFKTEAGYKNVNWKMKTVDI